MRPIPIPIPRPRAQSWLVDIFFSSSLVSFMQHFATSWHMLCDGDEVLRGARIIMQLAAVPVGHCHLSTVRHSRSWLTACCQCSPTSSSLSLHGQCQRPGGSANTNSATVWNFIVTVMWAACLFSSVHQVLGRCGPNICMVLWFHTVPAEQR